VGQGAASGVVRGVSTGAGAGAVGAAGGGAFGQPQSTSSSVAERIGPPARERSAAAPFAGYLPAAAGDLP